MKNFIKQHYAIAFLALVLSVGLFSLQTTSVSAVDACNGTAGSNVDVCETSLDTLVGSGSIAERIINTLLFVIGIISVIVIVVGGLRFVTSDGDSQKTTQARNTVLYAVVGLVVAASAYAIVNFVLTALG